MLPLTTILINYPLLMRKQFSFNICLFLWYFFDLFKSSTQYLLQRNVHMLYIPSLRTDLSVRLLTILVRNKVLLSTSKLYPVNYTINLLDIVVYNRVPSLLHALSMIDHLQPCVFSYVPSNLSLTFVKVQLSVLESNMVMAKLAFCL